MKLAGEVCTKLPQGLLHLDKLAYVRSLPKLRTKLPSTTYKIAPNIVWSLTSFLPKLVQSCFKHRIKFDQVSFWSSCEVRSMFLRSWLKVHAQLARSSHEVLQPSLLQNVNILFASTVSDRPSMGKGGWVKFSKIRFLLLCIHYSFILQMWLGVVIVTLPIKCLMLKSLPENLQQKWQVFSDNSYDITCSTGKRETWCSASAMYLNQTISIEHDNVGRSKCCTCFL